MNEIKNLVGLDGEDISCLTDLMEDWNEDKVDFAAQR